MTTARTPATPKAAAGAEMAPKKPAVAAVVDPRAAVPKAAVDQDQEIPGARSDAGIVAVDVGRSGRFGLVEVDQNE